MKLYLLTLLLHLFGRTKMSRRAFSLNYLVELVKSFSRLAVVDLEVKLISFSAVIPPQPNPNFFNMFIRLHLEVSTHLERVVQLSVSLYTSPKTPRQRRLFLSLEHLYYQTVVFAALMSLTRWTTTLVTFFTKQWSNRLYQWLKLVLFAL